jgi:hypothetical protein
MWNGKAINGDRPLPSWAQTDGANSPPQPATAPPQDDSADLPTTPLDGVSGDYSEEGLDLTWDLRPDLRADGWTQRVRPNGEMVANHPRYGQLLDREFDGNLVSMHRKMAALTGGEATDEPEDDQMLDERPTNAGEIAIAYNARRAEHGDPWAAAVGALGTKAQRAELLATAIKPWIWEYRDKYDRTWSDLAAHGNPSHSNSTFWDDIRREIAARTLMISDGVLKVAIKRAFEMLEASPVARNEMEPAVVEEPAGGTAQAGKLPSETPRNDLNQELTDALLRYYWSKSELDRFAKSATPFEDCRRALVSTGRGMATGTWRIDSMRGRVRAWHVSLGAEYFHREPDAIITYDRFARMTVGLPEVQQARDTAIAPLGVDVQKQQPVHIADVTRLAAAIERVIHGREQEEIAAILADLHDGPYFYRPNVLCYTDDCSDIHAWRYAVARVRDGIMHGIVRPHAAQSIPVEEPATEPVGDESEAAAQELPAINYVPAVPSDLASRWTLKRENGQYWMTDGFHATFKCDTPDAAFSEARKQQAVWQIAVPAAANTPAADPAAAQPSTQTVPPDLAAAGWELRGTEYGRFYLANPRTGRSTRTCAKVEQAIEIARGLTSLPQDTAPDAARSTWAYWEAQGWRLVRDNAEKTTTGVHDATGLATPRLISEAGVIHWLSSSGELTEANYRVAMKQPPSPADERNARVKAMIETLSAARDLITEYEKITGIYSHSGPMRRAMQPMIEMLERNLTKREEI